jgi:protein TonB
MRNTKKTAPEYPSAAKARRVEGKVLFRGLIGRDGKITTLELLSAPLALYDSARSAVSKWEYQPLRLQGEPVEVVTDITVNYKLQ